ncbi:spore coat protein YlbD [Evansella sp. AB-rgal1]|uniref:spore coat protein YlbD n=1 Tax=Evansella sp. AB-rgal1 TaxID=3242696 RepID=UPI00359D271A
MRNKKSLHPDVRKFKLFVKNNPHVLKGVKNGDKTLQDLFEEYLLFGEEDDIWETYREEDDDDDESDENDMDEDEDVDADKSKGKNNKNKKKESISAQDLLGMVKKMNLNDLQENLTQFSGVLVSIQELLGQFKQDQSQTPPTNQNQQQSNSPFSYRDD